MSILCYVNKEGVVSLSLEIAEKCPADAEIEPLVAQLAIGINNLKPIGTEEIFDVLSSPAYWKGLKVHGLDYADGVWNKHFIGYSEKQLNDHVAALRGKMQVFLFFTFFLFFVFIRLKPSVLDTRKYLGQSHGYHWEVCRGNCNNE